MKDYKTTLRMLPVCDCGYVFREGLVVSEDLNEAIGFKYVTHTFTPAMCPNCKKQIECITYERLL